MSCVGAAHRDRRVVAGKPVGHQCMGEQPGSQICWQAALEVADDDGASGEARELAEQRGGVVG